VNKKHIKKLISVILTIFIIVFFIYYFIKNPSILENLRNISLKSIFLILFIQFLILVVYSVLNHIVIKKIQKGVPFQDNLYLQFANTFLNKILPKGGAAFRGVYLKEMYNFPYSKFISTLSGMYIVSFLSYSVASFVCFIFFYFKYGLFNIVLIVAFVGLFLSSLILVFLPTKFFDKKKGKIFQILSSILNGWAEIKGDLKFIFSLTLIVVGILLLNTFQMQTIYGSLGLQVSFMPIFFLSVVSLLTIFINITPDGIGIKEGIYVFSSKMVNLASETLILASLIDRTLGLIIAIIFGGVSYLILLKKYNKKIK